MKKHSSILLICLFAIIQSSCDKKYSFDPLSPEYNPYNTTFYTGDTCFAYINFEPALEFYLGKNYSDTILDYIIIDSIDYNLDSIYDFAIFRNQYSKDSVFNMHKNSYGITELNNYSFYTIYVDQESWVPKAFTKGIILYDNLSWENISNSVLFNDLNSNYSTWDWNQEKYFAFRNYDFPSYWTSIDKGIIGWIKIEFISETASIRIEEIGYKEVTLE